MRDLLAGARCLLAGFSLICRPRVRLYVLLPLLVNTLLFATAFIYGAGRIADIIDRLIAQWPWAAWIAWLLWPLFLLFALLILFFLFSVIANVLAAPFNGFLARAVEESLSGAGRPVQAPGRPLLAEIAAALRNELRKLRFFAVRALPLLLLFLVPVAQAAAPLLWLLFAVWVLSLEYVEFPMGNHGITFDEVRAAARGRRLLMFGFGAAALLLTLIPIVNFLAMPVAVAGATRMWVERLRSPESA
jgi:CysZ protein